MKHLAMLIQQIYNDRMFEIREIWKKDGEGLYCEYELYIDDRESETFSTFVDLEAFVYSLYKRRTVGDAEDIKKGIDPYKNVPNEEENEIN